MDIRELLLANNVAGIDESVADYMTSVVAEECSDFTKGDPESVEEYVARLFDALNPFLQDYCHEATSRRIAESIVKTTTASFSTEIILSNADLNAVSVFRPVVLAELAEEESLKMKKVTAQAMGTLDTNVGGNYNSQKYVGNVEMDNRTRNRVLKKEKKAEERLAKELASDEFFRSQIDAEVVMNHRDPDDHTRWGGDIHIENMQISVAGKTLIENCDVLFQRGRRYGLVGRNGTGKTTLLRHISARELKGIPENLQIIHVEQEVHGTETSVLDVVLGTDRERTELFEEEAELMSSETEKDPERLSWVHQRLTAIDAYAMPAKAASVLSGLGFTTEMQNMPTKQFSGGWRMRVALAQALFVEPDMLLLDEPTNHLDLPAALWLESYLQTSVDSMILILVSHDREFLNNVVTDVVSLSQKALVFYKGNYDQFEETRMQRETSQKSQFEASEKRRKHVQQFIDRFRYNANRAALVQSRIKSLERMQEVAAVISDPEISFNFPTPEKVHAPILQCIEMSFGYNPQRMLFENVSFSLSMESRIAVVGPNGAGKSTLIKLLCDQLAATSGYLTRSGKLRIALFSQHHADQLDLSLNSIDQVIRKYPGSTVAEVRSHLGQFGVLGDMQMQTLRTLSGGQKSRVALAVLCYGKPHLLVLDEPTNHLDIDTVGALSQALTVFEGGVIVVSHDQHLIHAIADELWVIAGDGKIEVFNGDFAEYKKRYLPKK
jgi:ATP-binding cassette subfamily F protein 3